MPSSNQKILVVGQVPPPWGGQAVMIQKLLDSNLSGVQLYFVPMSFSSDMDEIGRFRWKKLFQLPVLVVKIWMARFFKGCSALYYSPGGESLTSICRDAFVLNLCRPFFRKTIFHVHAGGFSDVAEQAPWLIRKCAFLAYNKPELVIQLTEKSPPDGRRVRAKRIEYVPNGLADDGAQYAEHFSSRHNRQIPNLLFVGVVSPSKGVRVLLEACARLKALDVAFQLKIMGRFYSPEFEAECREYIVVQGLEDHVEFLGVKTGEDKWREFRDADIFCFPSHFESENQSLVILEAMQFGLPCVATDWRSMSTMVQQGETGFIVPVRDPDAFADCVEHLIANPRLRMKMGEKARQVFVSRYTDDVWRSHMENIF